jgi:hypothetical protein
MESPGTSKIGEGGDHPGVDTANCVFLGSEGEKNR